MAGIMQFLPHTHVQGVKQPVLSVVTTKTAWSEPYNESVKIHTQKKDKIMNVENRLDISIKKFNEMLSWMHASHLIYTMQ